VHRRSFLKSLVPLAGIGFPKMAPARQDCSPYFCASYIPLNQLEKIYAAQSQSQWCWAASISMIFAYSGHRVSQQRIVKEAYGSVVNMPGNYPAMLGSLNRGWTDDKGNNFSVSTSSLFAPDLGQTSLTNADLISELEDDNPILFCNLSHAMVLTAMKYTPAGVFEAWVMDPWPGKGLRRLTTAEMVPVPAGQLRFVATVSVS